MIPSFDFILQLYTKTQYEIHKLYKIFAEKYHKELQYPKWMIDCDLKHSRDERTISEQWKKKVYNL